MSDFYFGVPVSVEAIDFSDLGLCADCGINDDGHLSDALCVRNALVWRITPEHTPDCGCDGTGPYRGCGHTYYVCEAHLADGLKELFFRRRVQLPSV